MLFRTREEAGKFLAEKLKRYKNRKDVIILAIPRGGVPVAYSIAKALNLKFDLIIPRKLPIPFDPEAGFGAVINNTIVLNEELLERIHLSKNEINNIIKEVREEIKRRNKEYRKRKPFPNLKNKTVILVDDGLASGYTMLAAVRDIKKTAKKVIVAVPTASLSAFNKVKKEADVISLQVSNERIFAVASFYMSFPDLADKEVINYLENQ